MMRFLTITILIALTSYGFSQRQGQYIDSAGGKHRWYVSSSRSMTWNDKPFTPAGVWVTMTNPVDDSRYQIITDNKVFDVVLESPLQPTKIFADMWQNNINECEKRGIRYMLSVGADCPRASGYQITPQSFRISGITENTTRIVRLPGADKAYFAVVHRTEGKIVQSGFVNVISQTAQIDVVVKSGNEYVLLVYPHYPASPLPDYWEGYDKYRDNMISTLKKVKTGANFRGFIDPFGKQVKWLDKSKDVIPDSSLFKLEFERTLRKTYQTIDRLNVTWSVSEFNIPSYKVAARLIPLYSGNRGASFLLDPVENKLYAINASSSRYWRDASAVIKEASMKRARRLALSLKSAIADVPIVYTWTDWNPLFTRGDQIFDGLSYHANMPISEEAISNGAKALSSIIDWKPSGWLLAGDISALNNDSTDEKRAIYDALDWLKSAGARGFYLRVDYNSKILTAISEYQQRLNEDSLFTTLGARAILFPESAYTPAEITRLSPNVWWTPSDSLGGRLDWGETVNAYWISRPDGQYIVVWAIREPVALTFKMVKPKALLASSHNGMPVEIKTKKEYASLIVGTDPILISNFGSDLPAPEEAIVSTTKTLEAIISDAKKQKIEVGDLEGQFIEAFNLAKRSPSAGLTRIQTLLDNARTRFVDYLWIEAENCSDHIFGETPDSAPASNGKTLAINSAFAPIGGAYYAKFPFNLSADGEYTIWIAGAMPGTWNVSPLEFNIDTTPLTVVSEAKPFQTYGGKYGWYLVGTTQLAAGGHVLSIRCRSNALGEYLGILDAIVISRGAFTPNGVRKPLPK